MNKNNIIGATLQPNLPRKSTWHEFWDIHRYQHMFHLTNNVGGMSELNIQNLRQKVRTILSKHEKTNNLRPSLPHGDLWGGNKACILRSNK